MSLNSLSIIIPAYNEEVSIGNTIKDVVNNAAQFCNNYEVIVADDGSSDGTATIVKKFADNYPVRFLPNSCNTGKGGAVRRGVAAASKDYVLFMDADNSARLLEVARFLPFISDHDIVVGSRQLSGDNIDRAEYKHRQLIGQCFNRLVRFILGLKFYDTQCGFKLMSLSAARRVFGLIKETGFAFDVELLYIANRLGLKIKEVGISWFRSDTKSKVKLLKHSIAMFWALLAIRYRWYKL